MVNQILQALIIVVILYRIVLVVDRLFDKGKPIGTIVCKVSGICLGALLIDSMIHTTEYQ